MLTIASFSPGDDKATGDPWSQLCWIFMSSGTSPANIEWSICGDPSCSFVPNNSMSSSEDSFCAPLLPNNEWLCPQFGHTNTLIFWTIPNTYYHSNRIGTRAKRKLTGMLTFLNISAPRRASSRAMSWGVVTKTAPIHIEEWYMHV